MQPGERMSGFKANSKEMEACTGMGKTVQVGGALRTEKKVVNCSFIFVKQNVLSPAAPLISHCERAEGVQGSLSAGPWSPGPDLPDDHVLVPQRAGDSAHHKDKLLGFLPAPGRYLSVCQHPHRRTRGRECSALLNGSLKDCTASMTSSRHTWKRPRRWGPQLSPLSPGSLGSIWSLDVPTPGEVSSPASPLLHPAPCSAHGAEPPLLNPFQSFP